MPKMLLTQTLVTEKTESVWSMCTWLPVARAAADSAVWEKLGWAPIPEDQLLLVGSLQGGGSYLWSNEGCHVRGEGKRGRLEEMMN